MCPALAALLLVAGCSKDNDPIPVSGVELGKSAIELAVGQTERLSVTVLPDDASDQVVTWSSNDEAVATVGDNGTVTAVAEGTATITATAGGKSAACTVMVTGNSRRRCGYNRRIRSAVRPSIAAKGLYRRRGAYRFRRGERH